MARGNLMVPPEREEYSLGSSVVNREKSDVLPMDDDIRAEAAKLEQRLIDGEELTDIEQVKVDEYRAVLELEEQESRDTNRERKQLIKEYGLSIFE